MASIQMGAAGLIIKMLRSTLFIHKTETETHRQNFERISNITKYPRFVEMKPVKIAGMDAAWFLPDRRTESKTILYMPGGGYCVGSYNTHRAIIARIARSCGHPALGINYRKAPENPFPAALEDAFKAYMELQAQGHENIIIMGDSAGGGLCLSLMIKLREEGLPMPIGAVVISPWTDLSCSGDTLRTKENVDPLIDPALLSVFAEKYCQGMDPKNPYISPLFGEFDQFPPIYIQVGGNEVLLDDSTRLAKKLMTENIPVRMDIYEGMMHVWHYLGGIVPEANDAIHKIGDFVKELQITKKQIKPGKLKAV